MPPCFPLTWSSELVDSCGCLDCARCRLIGLLRAVVIIDMREELYGDFVKVAQVDEFRLGDALEIVFKREAFLEATGVANLGEVEDKL